MKPQSLNLTLEASRPAPPAASRAADPLDRLTAALEHEALAIRDLGEVLIRQRAAVAASDVAGVNASVDDVGRLLLAVDEARRHRMALATELGAGPETPLQDLEPAPGTPGAEAYVAARTALRRTAERTAHEAAVNRTVLRNAVEAGDAFLQTLFSSAEPPPVYSPVERRDRPHTPGVILNRRA